MEVKRVRALTENDVSGRSYRNKEYIDMATARALSCLLDSEKSKRLEQRRCVYCYYQGGRMAGQAMTQWNCHVCLKDQGRHSNTAVPEVCGDCSKKYCLCTECGADLHLRVRRNNTKILNDET